MQTLLNLGTSNDAALFVWQWHGRQMFTELRNDFRFAPKLHRVVLHLADVCEAENESAALAAFKAGYPDAQTTSLLCVGPVKQSRSRGRSGAG